ncbi:MAG: ABC transporter ATP-binding protein [Acidobacteriota bacterium]
MKTIQVENISKRYYLGDRLPNSVRDLLVKLVRVRASIDKSELWALRDISFEVAEGETLGIIGRNGAGKSTLLKILSRITKPTSGTATIRGRVGSLLEVGTGFHNELTGRENIYMSGAILGMRRAEIERKFDEIAAFSEVEQFLDTPVKHYSSGMYTRLAFSVAAHLEPEILIVDEVLAVGDTGFQNKCLGKMDEVSRSGRTVLFVSHNLGSLSQICTNGLLLHHGRIHSHGSIQDTVNDYLKLANEHGHFTLEDPDIARPMQITEAIVLAHGDRPTNEVPHNEEFFLSLRLNVRHVQRGAMFCVALLNKYKRRVFTEHKPIEELLNERDGEFWIKFRIPANFIAPNNYSFLIQIFFPDGEVLQELMDVCPFVVIDMGSDLAAYTDCGYVQIKGEWKVERR